MTYCCSFRYGPQPPIGTLNVNSVASAALEIWGGSQNSEFGHVTRPPLSMAYFCIVFVNTPPSLYLHAKFQVFSCSHSGHGRGVPKFGIKSRDPASDRYGLILRSFWSGPPPLYMHTKFQASSFSLSRDMTGVPKCKSGPPPTLCGGIRTHA